MLFHVTWEFTDTSEDGIRRSLDVFSKWQPPAGAEFKGFYGFADGGGGVALIEADSAATLARTTGPWAPWLRFTSTPILPIEESSALAGEAVAFRDSVGQSHDAWAGEGFLFRPSAACPPTLRVVDQFDDLDEADAWTRTVETGNPVDQLVFS